MPPKPRTSTPKKPGAGSGSGINRNLLIALGGAAVVAVVLVVVALVASGGDDAGPADGSASSALLAGIPQDFTVLGDPEAEVTLIEFADMQCPVCQRYAEDAFPGLVDQYVKPGDVKMQLRGLTFIGPDSEKALRYVLAAGLQDRAWQMADALYAAQGAENAGWVTEDLAREIGAGIDGLDVDKMIADTGTETVTKEIEASRQEGDRLQVGGTPTFFIQIGDEDPYQIQPTDLTAEAFQPALDDALGR
jgi:protein-disulfide isomerase